MNGQQGSNTGVINRVKHLYYVCKIAELVPFSFTVGSTERAEIIDTKISSYGV